MKAKRSITSGSPCSGFTLIELLVVVAIIGLLAGLSIPSINKVMARSKEVEKINNLRSIYVATTLYEGENNGRVLPAKDARVNNDATWRDILAPYVFKEDAGKTETKKQEVFIDPFFKGYDAAAQNGSRTGYALNICPGLPEMGDQNVYWSADQTFGHEFRAVAITHPNYRILIGDSDNEWFYNNIGKASAASLAADRHENGSKGMFLMFSGSVEKLTLEEAVLASENPEAFKNGEAGQGNASLASN